MRRASRTIYDDLRIGVGHDGAIKSLSPQSERPIIAASVDAAMDTSGIGQAGTGGWPSRHYSGGAVTPQTYVHAQPAGLEDQLVDAGMIMNARSANPSRGVTPRSPLLRRR
jgi:hypothetical protein